MQSHYLQRVDAHKLQKDPRKQLFDLDGCEGASAQGLEQNYLFVLDLSATLAGALAYPVHSTFKAGPWVLI